MPIVYVFGIVLAAVLPLTSFISQPEQVEAVTVQVVEGKVTRDKELTPSPTPTPTEEVVQESVAPAVQAPVNIPNATYTAPTEGVQDRLNRLASSMGITYPLVAADCHLPGVDPTMIRGCYWPGSYVIYITKYALMYDDAYVSCIIRHEARHLWQDLNGLYDIQSGVIVNRDWLEADATAYSGCS